MRDFEIPKGYFSYFTQGVVAHINNSLVATEYAPFNFAAEYEVFNFEKSSFTKAWHHNHAFLNHAGIAVSNFETSADFKPKFFGSSPEGHVGFFISSPEGKFYQNKALKVALTQYNQILLKNGNTTLALGSAERKPDGCINIKVVRNDKTIKVFINGNEQPAINYTVDNSNGGVVSLCADKAACEFANWKLKDLTPRKKV